MLKIICIVFFIFLLIAVLVLAIRNHKLDKISKREIINQKQNRKVYDFDKILSGKFVIYHNDHGNFSLSIPLEAEIYDADETAEADPKLHPLKPKGGISIALVSQLAQGTELFDGLHINITYYENIDKLTLESLISKVRKSYGSSEKILRDRIIEINGFKGYLFEHNDWGSESTFHYFISPDKEFIIGIYVYSIGPDEQKFDRVGDKVIRSLNFY